MELYHEIFLEGVFILIQNNHVDVIVLYYNLPARKNLCGLLKHFMYSIVFHVSLELSLIFMMCWLSLNSYYDKCINIEFISE